MFRDTPYHYFLLKVLMLCVFILTHNSLGIAQTSGSSSNVTLQNVDVGFKGTLKAGCWTPIAFELVGVSPGETYQPLVKTSDADGNPFIQTLPTISPSEETGSTGTLRIKSVFFSGRFGASIQLAVTRPDSNASLKWTTVLTDGDSEVNVVKQSTLLWLAIGEMPAFQATEERWNGILKEGVKLITIEGLSTIDDELPENAEGLDGIDLVVMNAGTYMNKRSSSILQKWVQRGGRLVLSFNGMAAFTDSPLSDWCPIVPTGEGDIRNLSGLNATVQGSSPLRLLSDLKAVQFDERQGVVLATGLAGPLLMRTSYGSGQVTVLAVDINQRPLSNWDNTSLTDFAAALANLPPPWENEALVKFVTDNESNLSPTGVTDLQTQLVNLLDAFPKVARTTHWGVLGWIALFIALIGPIDYFLLHRVLEKPRMTWITLPVAIVLVSAFAISQANSINQQPLQSRQVNLIDVDASLNVLRGKSWMNFYSPGSQRYDIESSIPSVFAPEDLADTEYTRMQWTVRPEPTFRGMYRDGDFDPGKPAYSLTEDRQTCPNLPVTQWSSASVTAEWEVDKTEIASSDLSVIGSSGLTGTFQHNLPGPVSNWLVCFNGLAFYPRTPEGELQAPLPPGQSVNVEDLGTNLLKGVLIGLRQSTIYRQKGDRTDPNISRDEYDIYNLDPFTNMRMISFHTAAGGTEYTNLDNQTQRKNDLSQLIRLHRAVLFGRLEQPATDFKINGEQPNAELNETYVRIIFPVTKKLRDNDAAPDAEFLKIIK